MKLAVELVKVKTCGGWKTNFVSLTMIALTVRIEYLRLS